MMNLNKLILLVLLLALLSCRKTHVSEKVWLCDNEDMMVINGNVKKVVIGDKQNFFKAYFSEKGDLQYSQKRDSDVWIDDSGKHSEINYYCTKYSPLYNNKGIKVALIGALVGDTIKSKWVLDKKGRVIGFLDDISNPSFCTSPYKYDNKGDLVGYKHIFGMMAAEPDVYTYKNDENHMITESRLYEAAYIVKVNFKYQDFDSHHNWTTRIVHRQSFRPMTPHDTTYTTTRQITYY